MHITPEPDNVPPKPETPPPQTPDTTPEPISDPPPGDLPPPPPQRALRHPGLAGLATRRVKSQRTL